MHINLVRAAVGVKHADASNPYSPPINPLFSSTTLVLTDFFPPDGLYASSQGLE